MNNLIKVVLVYLISLTALFAQHELIENLSEESIEYIYESSYYKNELIFSNGVNLMSTKNSTQSFNLLKDNDGNPIFTTSPFIGFEDELIFRNRFKMFQTDGTAENTRAISDEYFFDEIHEIKRVENKVLISAEKDDKNGFFIYNLDDNSIKKIKNNLNQDFRRVWSFTEYKGLIYFTEGAVFITTHLWAFSLETEKSQLIKVSNSSGLGIYGIYKDLLVLAINTNGIGLEPWMSDGTPSGTYLLKDIIPGNQSSGPELQLIANDLMYFTFSNRLWTSDGTAEGTQILPHTIHHDFPKIICQLDNGKIILSAQFNSGSKLYSMTNSEIEFLTKANTFAWPSGISYNMVHHKDKVFFNADDGNHGHELWESDGTSEGTKMVVDFYPGEKSSNPENLTLVKGGFYLTVRLEGDNKELYFYRFQDQLDSAVDNVPTLTDELSNALIKIYPNPIHNEINLEIKGNLDFQVNLYNQDGKLTSSFNNKYQIKVNALPPGIYLLEIMDNESKQKITEKVIIAK